MSAYLLSVLGTVIISSILTAVTMEGRTAQMVKGVAKLACLLAIIAPIPALFQRIQQGENADGFNFFEETVIKADNAFIQYYSERRIADTERQLQQEILRLYAVETSVKINWELENLVEKNDLSIMILGIFVYAPTDCALQQKNAIKAYLMENYCKEVQIE